MGIRLKEVWRIDYSNRATFRGVGIVCSLFFLVYLGNSLWLTLFPNHLLNQGMSPLLIGVVLMIYNAALSLGYLPSGQLSDRIGRRPLIVAGAILLALGALSLSLSTEWTTTILAVIVEGIGLALLAPSSNALISEIVSGKGSGSAFSIYQIATLSASVVGSFAAGALAETVGFPKMFLLSAIIIGSAGILSYVIVPETLERKTLAYASAVSKSLRSSITGTAAMLRSNKELSLLTGALAVHSTAITMINPFVPLFAEKAIRLDIAQVGVIMSMSNAGNAIAQIPAGHLTDRFGGRRLLLTHLILSSLCYLFYAWSWNLESGITLVFFCGIVGALDMPARRTIMIEYTTKEAGKATIIGTLDAITGTVGIIGPLIGGIVWATMGYAAPFVIGSIINAFACLPFLLILRNRSQRRFPAMVKTNQAAPNMMR